MSLLSVMSVAMHLSGLGAEHFTQDSGSKVKWLYEEAKILQQQQTTQGSQSPALSSASSSTESSGFNSWPGSDHSPPAGDDVVADNFNLVAPNVEVIVHFFYYLPYLEITIINFIMNHRNDLIFIV